MLTGGRRTALPRQQTLRATLDWSYQLLPEAERRLLRHVAVMAGGFTVEAAEAVLDDRDGPAPDVLDGLARLTEKALLVLDDAEGATRWRLLETVREYALERLVKAGEAERALRKHAMFYRDLFVPRPAVWRSAPTLACMATCGREIDNVRAALDWAFRDDGDTAIGVALTAAYVPYLLHLSLMDECRERAERAMASIGPDAALDPRLVVQLHVTLGLALIYSTTQVQRTGSILGEAVRIAAGLHDIDMRLQALWAMFIYSFNNSEHHSARAYAERFSVLAQEAGGPADILMGCRVMGTTMHYAGDQPAARRHYERYLAEYAAPAAIGT